MNKIKHFFWWCAGANIDLLEKCPIDHAKYFGVGGTILFTALMASFAGGYAFYVAFKSFFLAILFGVFWGGLIFNLDRYIVATIGKGDGTQKITIEEWKLAAPRLLMAILLGFVISTPLELKIFETEIQTIVERLKIDKAEELKNRDSTFLKDLEELKTRRSEIEGKILELTNNKTRLAESAASYYDERKKEIEIDYEQTKEEYNLVQKEINSLHRQYLKAKRDSLPNEKILSLKKLRDKKIEERKKINLELKEKTKEISELIENKGRVIEEEAQRIANQLSLLIVEKERIDEHLQGMELTKQKKANTYESKVQNYDGFAAHLEALHVLTEEKSVIFWAKWLITVLFIFIEVSPVLFKLMAEAGPYDDAIDRIKHESFVKTKEQISKLNDMANTRIQLSALKNKAKLEAELKGNKALLEKIALAQVEILEKAIEKWKEEELTKLKLGNSHIIRASKSECPVDGKA